jgi:hypothetical protein
VTATRARTIELDQRPDTSELRLANRVAIELGIRAGISGALLTLMEAGVLPGAFEDDE